MDVEKRMELVLRKPTLEVVTEEELRNLFETNEHPKHYIGFEISGYAHLGTGLMTALKIKDFIKAGMKSTILFADYHTWINGKLGGDLPRIRRIARGYFEHVFTSLGLQEVEFVLASEMYDEDYWKDVLDVARNTSIKRMLRCTTIMGRKESETLSSSAILYPAMQIADIKKLEVDIAHSGMDQRKVHMLQREVADKIDYRKVIALHTSLLSGLSGGTRMNSTVEERIEAKMSKSRPDSAIFVHDSEEEIRRKMKKAYCPEKVVEGNPVMEMAENLVLRDSPLKVSRPEKYGGEVEFVSFKELSSYYSEGKLHPMDLKNAVGEHIIGILEPVRKFFSSHEEMIKEIEEAKITR
ncbi:tyrosine--tRNA ligase [Candidatus Micrarchaeota archaeon]|nr:tyrosine--tRNA ligase [Candidatus Micrarchaeota archaeon]